MHSDAPPPPGVEDELVLQLARECTGLPLALQVVGSALHGKPQHEWSDMLQQLQTIGHSQLSQMDKMLARCKTSYTALSPALQRCYIDFAAYPEDARVPASELVALWAAQAPLPSRAANEQAAMHLALLAERSLVHCHVLNSYYMHDILRGIAVKEAACSSECSFYVSRGVDMWPGAKPSAVRRHQFWRSCMSPGGAQAVATPGLRYVSMNSNALTRPPAAWDPSQLRMLYLQSNKFEVLPEVVAQCSMLCVLSLAHNEQLTRLPDAIGELWVLQVLDLQACASLEALPDCLGDLGQLQSLTLNECSGLQQLPVRVGDLSQLHSLRMDRCWRLQQLPERIGDLGQLQSLGLSGCEALQRLPERIGDLGQLQSLELDGCEALQRLPKRIGDLGQLQRLSLSGLVAEV
jgi:Leucine rich repeat